MLSAQAAAAYPAFGLLRRLGSREKRDQPAKLMPLSGWRAALFFYSTGRYFMPQCSVTLCCFFSRLPAVRTKTLARNTKKFRE